MSDIGKVTVVVGGQFGSEAKGAVAAYLAKHSDAPVSAVRVAGPNAGHTVYGSCPIDPQHGFSKECYEGHHNGIEHPWRLRQIPVPAVSRPDAWLYIAAGSEIDPAVLADEATELDKAGYQVGRRITIDNAATVIEAEHVEAEQLLGMQQRLGSTAKGIGAARSARIWRKAQTWSDTCYPNGLKHVGADTASMLATDLREGRHVIIEGTQGYGLGLHTEFYPYTTSSDCRAIDFLAMAGISPWAPHVASVEVWVVLRTRPIRVAGNSGPLADETGWDALGLPAEHTTVTKKVRRVGGWDGELARQAVIANGGASVNVALTMVDQVFPWIAGRTEIDKNWTDEELETLFEYIDDIEDDIEAPVSLVGTGPTSIIRIQQEWQRR